MPVESRAFNRTDKKAQRTIALRLFCYYVRFYDCGKAAAKSRLLRINEKMR